MLNSLDTSSIGPLWHIAHIPLVEPGVIDTSSNIARPRFCEVEAVTHEQRVVGVGRQTRVPGRERTGFDAVAGDTGSAVASEGLFVEEATPLFEPFRQTPESGCTLKLCGIAVERARVRCPRFPTLCLDLQHPPTHEDRGHEDDGEAELE
jgi:hypothetical protein